MSVISPVQSLIMKAVEVEGDRTRGNKINVNFDVLRVDLIYTRNRSDAAHCGSGAARRLPVSHLSR